MQKSKTGLRVFIILAITWASGTSCTAQQQSAPASEAQTVSAVKVDSVTCTATVKAIDQAKRSITLHMPNGADRTFIVAKEAVNFDQIKVGDQVKATIAESLAVHTRKPGAPAESGQTTTVALAAKGSMPGALVADTVEVTAKVVDVDQECRMATLQGEDGKTRTIHVGPNINLAAVSKGDEVVFRYTQAVALRVDRASGSEEGQLASSQQRGVTLTKALIADATVVAVDKELRIITLARADGTNRKVQAAPGINLDELKAGDPVKVTLVESLGLSLHKADAPAAEHEPDTVELAAADESGKPVTAIMRQATATVEAIDTESRAVTLKGSDGKTQIVEVGPQADLKAVAVGDHVILRYTAPVAIKIEK